MNATQTYETKQTEQKPKKKAGMVATAILGLGISLASLVGCQSPSVYRQVEKANNYDVEIVYHDKEHKSADIRIGNRRSDGSYESLVYATDYDRDGRFDRIHINAPKGSPLEKLASIERIGEIYTSLKK